MEERTFETVDEVLDNTEIINESGSTLRNVLLCGGAAALIVGGTVFAIKCWKKLKAKKEELNNGVIESTATECSEVDE